MFDLDRGDVGDETPLLDEDGSVAVLESGVPFKVLVFGERGGDNTVESSTVVANAGSQHSFLTYRTNSLVSSIDFAAPFST